MSEHPGTVFRPAPTGRLAALASGPDVREAVRAVKPARSTEPDLADERLLGLIADNTGTPLRLIRTAVPRPKHLMRRTPEAIQVTSPALRCLPGTGGLRRRSD